MESVNNIRKAFLDYFESNGHKIMDSSSLVPLNDPTLMFTNAGMVQFKNIFTGIEKSVFNRAVTSQKCVRAGGKHNDLENVGYTARHHTFFEMLGNFSFGDYFKETAIELAWGLVTKEFSLPAEKLLVTVHSSDEDAADLWKKIAGISDHKIIRIPTSDNFWAMGDTGPCGPCSEIFFDHGDHISGGAPGSPNEDGDRFIEIWNLVFMQFEQVTLDERVDLPKPSIDTGMGLERIAAVLQGTHDNYEIDLMRSLILDSSEKSGVPSVGKYNISHRVIADHLRASSFLIADGVLPSNDGRGYVLRRIMRRAMRHAHLMGCEEPLIYRLVPQLVHEMGSAFPEILRGEALITETLRGEELRFKKTLHTGLKLLEEATDDFSEGDVLGGDVVFKLYDTFGFPLDLTQDALRNRGMFADIDGFKDAMDKQKAEARSAWAGSGSTVEERIWFEILEKTGPTDFLGYETDFVEAKALSLVKDGKIVNELAPGNNGIIIVNQSPFYAESGGQLGDCGEIIAEGGLKITVTDTKKYVGGLHAHFVTVIEGLVTRGTDIILKVDARRRKDLRANHSATHLLHAALRRLLGEHVTQKGSLVAPDRLRFDISHPKGLDSNELSIVENYVNDQIAGNFQVTTRLMEPENAVKAGAMALFGEKYGDEVRVVSMGKDGENFFSTELCGGTHVETTGEIGAFKILSEGAVGSGLRRIEAVTGVGVRQYFSRIENALIKTANLLKINSLDVPVRVGKLISERRQLELELGDLRRQMASMSTTKEKVRKIGDVKFVSKVLKDIPVKELRGVVDDFKRKMVSGVVVIISKMDGKANLIVGVTEDLIVKVNAVELVNIGAIALGGKGGGGRPDLAQAGGPNSKGAEAAFDLIFSKLEQDL